jgi:hypothetical protein
VFRVSAMCGWGPPDTTPDVNVRAAARPARKIVAKSVMPPSQTPESVPRRQPQVAERLSVDALRWLDQLPVSVRPRHLEREFPRIANALSRQWRSPSACIAYLDELLMDKRGDRRGFPLEIVLELATLKSHFQTAIYPVPQTVWGEIMTRSRER